MRPEHQERPSIKIFIRPGHNREQVLQALCLGIEEEAIPFEAAEVSGQDAAALAWQASHASRLEVGLGLDHDRLVLHYAKLREDQPLFSIPARAPDYDIRAIGANAARLVKRLPLKPLGQQ